jgi:ectoine hydroxylase-related dioxygenase (phytanoyl-CoA dioxygenase family)
MELTEPWLQHLEEYGYVVVKAMASAEELKNAQDAFWECLEAKHAGVKRNDLATWDKWRLDARGIVLDGDVLHCKGAWAIRGLAKVQEAFAAIWEDRDLISSFDSTLLWRPWWEQKEWTPRVEGLHMDQNPFQKPGRHCVQGMVPLLDVTAESGGLAVVPGSHKDESIMTRHRFWDGRGDFCVLFGKDPVQKQKVLVLAEAGDLILWDSRTVHGGLVGTGRAMPKTGEAKLARLTQTVCMIPR